MCIKILVQVYRSAEFRVCMFLMDEEFEYPRRALLLLTLPIKLNINLESEHAP